MTDWPEVRAVIFDLDGVLTDTAEFHYQAWQRLAEEEGLAFDRDANEHLRGVSRRDSLRWLLGERTVASSAFTEMMTRKNTYYVSFLDGMSPADALDGAVQLVVDAKRRGFNVAIGSSSKNAVMVLDKLGLTSLFDVIADGNAVEQAKPAPDLFLHAAKELEVPAENCVVIEDAGSGVDAALAAGMIAVGIGPEDRVGHAQHRFETTAEINLETVVPYDEHRLGTGPLVADGWVVIDDHHDPDQVFNVATSHLTGNGYLGYRGTLPEWDASTTVGCVVSDTWDNADGKWTELCTVPNALYSVWSGLGEKAGVDANELLSDRDLLERRLDVRYGRQHRVLEPATGVLTRLDDERFASLDQRHLLVQRQYLYAEPGSRLTWETGIDGDVWSINGDHFATRQIHERDDTLSILATTGEHGLPIAVTHASAISGGVIRRQRTATQARRVMRVCEVDVGSSGRVVIDQVMTVYTGNDVSDPLEASVELAKDAVASGYEPLLARHALAWDRLWDKIDVGIDGDPIAQAVLRYNLYHSIIATPMHTDHLPIGARGLSCQAYQGAAFWDQEAYNLAMWVHTFPDVARNLLTYRHRTLAGATRKATRLGYEGAFYAWISGATGDELCPDFFFTDVLTGRPIRNHFNDWQIHISPDIATAIEGYGRATGDDEFVRSYGAPIVFEVARFLASYVYWRPADGAYHLVRLLGPDEYHENVDDNVFTLEQARAALSGAVALWDRLEADHPEDLATIRTQHGFKSSEREQWQDIIGNLVEIKPDPDTHLLEQFSGYFNLEDVTPAQMKKRLQHPDEYFGWPNGVAVHTQVIKQADVIQLFVNQPERFASHVIAANYDYYLPRTSHGSSLSRPTYALVAARIGRLADAYELFMRSATVDLLADSRSQPGGTFIGGIHVAAAGAAWQVVVLGFGGVHIRDDHVEIHPRLPDSFTMLRFGLAVRGGWADVEAARDHVTVHAADGNADDFVIDVHGQRASVAPGERVTVPFDMWDVAAPTPARSAGGEAGAVGSR